MSQGVIEAKPDRAKGTWKQRLAREFISYWINVAYLAVFFGAFAWYRRFILAEYGITYLHYGSALIEALILAKVVLVGDALGLSRGMKNRPLIYPTLHKTMVFTVFVGIFAIVEHVVEGLVHGKGVAAGLAALWHEGRDEIVSRCLVTFFAFIPFFAFRELEEFLGERKLLRLFFGKDAVTGAAAHG
jgi:hypothetical protein